MIVARYLVLVLVLTVVVGGGAAGLRLLDRGQATASAGNFKTPEEDDIFVRFVMEGYDIIQASYWQKAEDTDLSAHFLLSIQKAASSTALLGAQDRGGIAKLLKDVFRDTPEDARVRAAEDILRVALANLAPLGRNQLLSAGGRADLQNELTNVNPGKDLYKDLGLDSGANAETVADAFEEKKKELEATTTADAAQELEKISYAKDVLTDTDSKANYDESRVEPTVFARLANPTTLYVYISKMSPATLAEFENAVRSHITPRVASMILDLRGNLGGDLTTSQTFLGLFQGPNQYAFDFFHRGAYEDQRTLGLGAMLEMKQVRELAVLTDEMTQSTAEVITAAVKKLHLGFAVGKPTRGWGSVEQILPMQTVIEPGNAHTMLLVVRLTVRDDGSPIEGQGVSPDIDTREPDWQSKLSQKFFSGDLTSAIKKALATPPQK